MIPENKCSCLQAYRDLRRSFSAVFVWFAPWFAASVSIDFKLSNNI
jgi:hypothetical protein